MRGKHLAPKTRGGRSSFMMTGLLIGLLLAMAMPVAAGPAPKVDVCHAQDNGSYHLINISENAFETHVEHGDGSPGEAVPGMDGVQFGPSCEVTPIPDELIADGYFSNNYGGSLLETSFVLYQEWDGDYVGTGDYAYEGRELTFSITDACVDQVTNQVTVRGDVTTATQAGDNFAMISIHDNGAGTFRTRAGIRGTAAELDPFFAAQCGGNLGPASGPIGALNIYTP